MNEQVPASTPSRENHSRSLWLAVAAIAVLGVGASIYQGSQTQTLRRQMTAAQQDSDALRAKLVQSDAELQNALTSLRQDLADTKQGTTSGLVKAQQAATRHADLLAQSQKAQARQLSEELGKVKETTEQATAKLDGITTDVGSVKTEVGSVRSDVDNAKSNIEVAKTELQRMRGDLGLMSGLVATNGKEIQVLRDLGDRNIFEFTLSKSGGLQKVGDIQVALKKVDVKRNRYTVDVLADDKRVEKKDKGANEPVQFYMSGARQPYELVINQVKNNQVTGYLATPKVMVSSSHAGPAAADAQKR
jgi:archaellum component FlaC